MKKSRKNNSISHNVANSLDWTMHYAYLGFNILTAILFVVLSINPYTAVAALLFFGAVAWNVLDTAGAVALGVDDVSQKNFLKSFLNFFSATQLGIFTVIYSLSYFMTLSPALIMVGSLGATFGFAAAMFFAAAIEYVNVVRLDKKIVVAKATLNESQNLDHCKLNAQKLHTLEIERLQAVDMTKQWIFCGVAMAGIAAVPLSLLATFAISGLSLAAAVYEEFEYRSVLKRIQTLRQKIFKDNGTSLVKKTEPTNLKSFKKYALNLVQLRTLEKQANSHLNNRNLACATGLASGLVSSVVLVALLFLGAALLSNPFTAGAIMAIVLGICIMSGVTRLMRARTPHRATELQFSNNMDVAVQKIQRSKSFTQNQQDRHLPKLMMLSLRGRSDKKEGDHDRKQAMVYTPQTGPSKRGRALTR